MVPSLAPLTEGTLHALCLYSCCGGPKGDVAVIRPRHRVAIQEVRDQAEPSNALRAK